MSTRFEDGIAFLNERLADEAAVSITLSRGSHSVSMTAVPQIREYTIALESGLGFTNVTSRDYVMLAADVIINGSQVNPRQGDMIRETIGGVEFTMQVSSFGSMPACERRDAGGTSLLVHTKQLEPS